MIEIKGNLWDYYDRGEWICITTNAYVRKDGRLVMGRGCAREARDRIQDIDLELGRFVLARDNFPACLAHLRIISFPVKAHFRDKATIRIISRSAYIIRDMVLGRDLKKIVIPRPGCGYGHLDWATVQPVLESIFDDDRFVIITFDSDYKPRSKDDERD